MNSMATCSDVAVNHRGKRNKDRRRYAQGKSGPRGTRCRSR